MPISSDKNKTLPFTLIEVMALLVFVLMLSFAGINLNSESAKTCDDEVDEEAGEKCSPITESDFSILDMYACDTTEEDCDRPQEEGLRPCIEGFEAGDHCYPVDPEKFNCTDLGLNQICTKVDTTVVACTPDSGPNQACISVDTTTVRCGDIGPGQKCIPVDDPVALCMESTDTLEGLIACLGNVGLGSCWWVDDVLGGTPVPAVRVVFGPESLSVSSIWPGAFAQRAGLVDGLGDLVGTGTMSYDEFATRALPVLRWSMGQVPECRLYAERYYSAAQFEGNIPLYDRRRTEIEDRFYPMGPPIDGSPPS